MIRSFAGSTAAFQCCPTTKVSTILSIIAVKNNFNLDFIVHFTHHFQLQTYLVLLKDKLICFFFSGYE